MSKASDAKSFLGTPTRGVVFYLPGDPGPVREWIGSAQPEFVCFLYEDDPSLTRVRNEFLIQLIGEHINTFVDPVPLPKNTTDSFEWLYSKMNWEVDYFLEKCPGSKTSDMLLCVSSDQVPIVVVLYTVALQRGTRFAYLDLPGSPRHSMQLKQPVPLPNLFHVSGEPYRSSAFRKYREGRFADAADDFRTAYERAGDKQMEALRLLSECYAALDRLAYSEALEKLTQLASDENCCQELVGLAGSGAKDALNRLREFLEVASQNFGSQGGKQELLSVFSDSKAVEVFVRSLYASASRRFTHGEYEAAALLLYRIIEAVVQSKLASKGIDASNLDASRLSDEDWLKFSEFSEEAYHKEVSQRKDKLGLADAWMLYLSVFYENELGENASPEHRVRYMQRVRSLIELRNKCYLEHGTRGVTRGEAEQFQGFTAALVERFLKVTLRTPDEDDTLRPLRLAEQP